MKILHATFWANVFILLTLWLANYIHIIAIMSELLIACSEYLRQRILEPSLSLKLWQFLILHLFYSLISTLFHFILIDGHHPLIYNQVFTLQALPQSECSVIYWCGHLNFLCMNSLSLYFFKIKKLDFSISEVNSTCF